MALRFSGGRKNSTASSAPSRCSKKPKTSALAASGERSFSPKGVQAASPTTILRHS